MSSTQAPGYFRRYIERMGRCPLRQKDTPKMFFGVSFITLGFTLGIGRPGRERHDDILLITIADDRQRHLLTDLALL